MLKVAYGESQKWLDTHCSILHKKFSPKEDRKKGHCVLRRMMKRWTFQLFVSVPKVPISKRPLSQ
jgi:hypothetical protein